MTVVWVGESIEQNRFCYILSGFDKMRSKLEFVAYLPVFIQLLDLKIISPTTQFGLYWA